MNEALAARLTNCFLTVFSDRSAEEVIALRRDDYAPWDSFASLNLVALVEEEFGVAVPLSQLAQLDSFAACEAYLRQHLTEQAG